MQTISPQSYFARHVMRYKRRCPTLPALKAYISYVYTTILSTDRWLYQNKFHEDFSKKLLQQEYYIDKFVSLIKEFSVRYVYISKITANWIQNGGYLELAYNANLRRKLYKVNYYRDYIRIVNPYTGSGEFVHPWWHAFAFWATYMSDKTSALRWHVDDTFNGAWWRVHAIVYACVVKRDRFYQDMSNSYWDLWS